MNQEQGFDKLLMVVLDIQADVQYLKTTAATKEDIVSTKQDILTTVDRFVVLHETLDQELVAMRAKYSRLEDRLERVERSLGITAI